jgi:hypothetical protein
MKKLNKKKILKKKFKNTKSTKFWSPKSESENESIIKLKKSFKKAKGAKFWSPKGVSENEGIENNNLTPSSVKLTTKKETFIIINEDKNESIWSFICKYIDDNSAELLLLRDKYDTDDDFFRHLSKKLINKLSTETELFKNLHRNTKKALPKVIIAIYLLHFQKSLSITGNDLEKKSGMEGQYKKLRVIADHLDLELPFIMGDVVEKILDEKKEEIFKRKFFPSQENVCRLDIRLTPSRKMVKTISRWIKKNSEYKNLTDLHNRLFENKLPKPKEVDTRLVLLDKDKNKNAEQIRKICDIIIEENLEITSYNAISRRVGVSVTDFMRTDHRRYIKYSDFLALQELYGKPISHQIFVRAFRSDKWIFLWQDSEGNLLTDNQSRKAAGDYLLKDVLQDDTSKYDMDYVSDVLGRNDFISILTERGLKFNDVLKAVGLEINVEPKKWEDFNWSPDGNPRSYEEALANAGDYLKKVFSDEKYDFQSNDVNSFTDLTKDHSDFLGALKNNDLDYYIVLTKAGFPNDKWRGKWKVLDTNAEGFPYTPNERYNAILQFFKDNVLPIFRKNNLIKGKIGPSYDDAIKILKHTEYHGFISAINWRDMSYGELLYSVSLSPRVTLNQKIGTIFHWIAEYNFMMHTRVDNNCISYYEAKIHDDDEHRPDNSVKVNKNFRDLSKEAKSVSEDIKWINIDYYLFHSSKRGIYKSDRGYQSEDSLLILNPLNIKSDIVTTKENVRILSGFNFCKFFGFSEERKKDFIDFARLALQATNKDNTEALNKLLQEAERCQRELTSNPKINFKF